jgi:hypothetical protein
VQNELAELRAVRHQQHSVHGDGDGGVEMQGGWDRTTLDLALVRTLLFVLCRSRCFASRSLSLETHIDPMIAWSDLEFAQDK